MCEEDSQETVQLLFPEHWIHQLLLCGAKATRAWILFGLLPYLSADTQCANDVISLYPWVLLFQLVFVFVNCRQAFLRQAL